MRSHALWLLCIASPAVAGGAQWIGREVPPYPDGLVEQTGACVGSGTSADDLCASSIAVLGGADGAPRFIAAARAAGPVEKTAHGILTDVIDHPRVAAGEALLVSACERDGIADMTLVAVVDTAGAAEMYDAVRWAVRLQDGKFVQVPVKGIRCVNEGYGE